MNIPLLFLTSRQFVYRLFIAYFFVKIYSIQVVKLMTDNFDLSKFNSYREDNRREVKKAQDKLPDSLWDTYSAFANCYGGVIILGVKENKDGNTRNHRDT